MLKNRQTEHAKLQTRHAEVCTEACNKNRRYVKMNRLDRLKYREPGHIRIQTERTCSKTGWICWKRDRLDMLE